MVGVENVKMPRLLTFARHVETAIIKVQKLMSATLRGSRTLLVTTGSLENLEKNPPCNAENNLRARLIVIEAWFRGYLGSPGLGGPRTAGLLDYEDTILKTSSCVRVGLSFAWKASLAIQICVSPSL